MNDEKYTKLPAVLNLPLNNIKIPQVRDYVDKLNKVLMKAWSDVATIINGNVMTVGNNVWLFHTDNGHWWKFELENDGMAVTVDLGTELPAEYK